MAGLGGGSLSTVRHAMSVLPEEAGAIVSMLEHNGEILIACQHRIYRLGKEFNTETLEMTDVLEPLKFTVVEP